MRILFAFIVLLMLALVIGAIISYPAYIFLANWFEPEFESVANRAVLLSALILIFLAMRILGFKLWQEIGFDSNKIVFWKNSSVGFGYGVLIMSPVIAGLLLTKNRLIGLNLDWSLASVFTLLFTALIAGFVVSLIEETLIRGAMFTAVRKQSSTLFAIVTTSFIYAFIHFLKPEIEISADEISWLSGFILLKSAFIPFLSPTNIIDSFIALFLAGTLLAIIKARTNKLALCIGMHAGWVFVIKVFKRVTDSNYYSEFAFLTGSYDKVIGYLAAICLSIAIIIFLRSNKAKINFN